MERRFARLSARAPRPARVRTALAGAVAVIALAVAACGQAGATGTPTETQIPFGPTPWPSGTTGQYGLHIDPSLLGLLPRTVDAYQIVESGDLEKAALDDADLARTFDNYAAASIGMIGEDNWLQLVIGHLRADAQTPDVYTSWVSDYATGACSQADGVSGSSQPTISDWIVDVATCAGGPVVYTLSLGKGTILSMYGLGPRDLGRKLIASLY